MKVYNFRLFPNTISIPRHVRHKLYIFRENRIANRLNVFSLPFSFNLFSNASYIGIETLLRVALLYSPQHFEHLYFLLSYFTLFSSILFLLSNRMNTIIIIFFFFFSNVFTQTRNPFSYSFSSLKHFSSVSLGLYNFLTR